MSHRPRRESKVERMRRYGKERNEKRKKAGFSVAGDDYFQCLTNRFQTFFPSSLNSVSLTDYREGMFVGAVA